MSTTTLQIDISWPDIPLPFTDYTGSPTYNTIVSSDDAFIIERRSRFSRCYHTLSVTWNFSNDEFTTFKNFFANTLNNGTSQFNLEVRYPLNSALTHWSVRFVDTFQASYIEGRWNVTAVIDLLNPVNL